MGFIRNLVVGEDVRLNEDSLILYITKEKLILTLRITKEKLI